jgi:hypothetical protein
MPRGLPQEQVLEGRRLQRRETGDHASRVGGEHRAVPRVQQSGRAPGFRAEAVQPRLLVDLQRTATHELGQLPRGPPARQIHLEEPILRVEEPGGARHVFA